MFADALVHVAGTPEKAAAAEGLAAAAWELEEGACARSSPTRSTPATRSGTAAPPSAVASQPCRHVHRIRHRRQRQPGAPGSRSEFDRDDDRRLQALGQGLVLEVKLEGLPQVGESFVNGMPSAGDLDLKATSDLLTKQLPRQAGPYTQQQQQALLRAPVR